MSPVEDYDIIWWKDGISKPEKKLLISEEPLSIRVEGKPYAVTMRTPGDEIPHVAGFCLSEGVVDRPGDIRSIGFCDGEDTNVVAVTLSDNRRNGLDHILDRRGYISQTSCGICGKELVEELQQELKPIETELTLNPDGPLICLKSLSQHQKFYKTTRATHAAALFDVDLQFLAAAEDVGRHNALDKVIGKLFLDDRLDSVALAVMSSRISYELVQKAARARIPILCGISHPTALAVKLAEKLKMTLVCRSDDQGLYIFTGGHRFGL